MLDHKVFAIKYNICIYMYTVFYNLKKYVSLCRQIHVQTELLNCHIKLCFEPSQNLKPFAILVD